MTGAEHYAEAERLISVAGYVGADDHRYFDVEDAAETLAAAQVHATLALAAAVDGAVPRALAQPPATTAL